MTSHLDDRNTCILIAAALVKKLGGTVNITQDDLDAAAYNTIIRTVEEDNSLTFTLVERPRTG